MSDLRPRDANNGSVSQSNMGGMVNPYSRYNNDTNTRIMAIPCGLAARSTFDDSYTLYRCEKDFSCTRAEGQEININRTGIA